MTTAMSVTIPTPASTQYVTATIHLATEQDVIEEARKYDVEPFYVPAEGSMARLIIADTHPQPDLTVSLIARVLS